MILLHRRMMMMAREQIKELFNINTARMNTDSWRNIVYTIKDGALTITSGDYTWSYVNIYFDNCIKGKTYQLTFKMSTERERLPNCQLVVDNNGINMGGTSPTTKTFVCGDDVPFLRAYWSTSKQETLPITYYDFVLEEV